jgi:hypothetical protein
MAGNMITLEYLIMTGYIQLLNNNGGASIGMPADAKEQVQAVLAGAQYRVDWLMATVPSAQPVTTAFGGRDYASLQEFFTRGIRGSTIFLSGYIAAARQMAEIGQPQLAKNMFQAGGAWAEVRALYRQRLASLGVAGNTPAVNRAFETDWFVYTRDTVDYYRGLGFILGPGPNVAFQGRDAALAAAGATATAVIQRTPNNATTSPAPGADVTGERT